MALTFIHVSNFCLLAGAGGRLLFSSESSLYIPDTSFQVYDLQVTLLFRGYLNFPYDISFKELILKILMKPDPSAISIFPFSFFNGAFSYLRNDPVSQVFSRAEFCRFGSVSFTLRSLIHLE